MADIENFTYNFNAKIGDAKEFSGVWKESKLREMVANLDSDDYETRREATSFLCTSICHIPLMSDILLVEGSVDALKRANEKSKVEWKHSCTEQLQIGCLIEMLEAKSVEVPSMRLGYDPTP